MSSGSAIRGSRVGSSPMRPDERSEPAPRREVTYFCAAGHASQVPFAADVAAPETWDCPRCGQPAGLDRQNPPGPDARRAVQVPPGVREGAPLRRGRRKILAEALAKLRQRRGE